MKTIILLAGLLPALLYAADPHHDHQPGETTTIINTYKSIEANDSATAIGIAAAQHHFDAGTYLLQGSVGLGSFNGANALSFGFAKRIGVGKPLVNGSFSINNDDIGVGAGINMRFK